MGRGEFSLDVRSCFMLLHFSGHGTVSNLATLEIQVCTKLEASEGALLASAVVGYNLKRMGAFAQ